MEPPVSDPVPTAAKFAATATPVPPDDPPRRSREVVRIFHLSPQRTRGNAAGGKFRHVGFAKNQRPGFAQLLDRERIPLRLRSLQRERARGRRHVRGIEIVFQHDRNATQRLQFVSALELLVHRISFLQAPRIDVQHGLQRRSLLLVSSDAIQVLLHKLMARQRAGQQSLVNVLDRSLHQLKRMFRSTISNRHHQKNKKNRAELYANKP
jgi:hypothetical protein